MTYFIRQGANYRIAPDEAIDLKKELPVGSYILGSDLMGFYLEMVAKFEQIPKLYGDVLKNAHRVLNTFQERPNATGAMFTGEKGSGKTLLAKTISIEGVKLNIPTIIINQPYHGDAFNKFLHDINQACIIVFDEFEKVYNDDENQESILTLLDGVFPSKKLFIFTCNDKWKINIHMRNRPGRIFYMLDFDGLDQNFIIDYCKNNLKKSLQEHITKICEIVTMFDKFNFDMLKALVEEMNRYNETPAQALKLINAKPEYGNNQAFVVNVGLPNGKELYKSREWSGNPLMGSFSADFVVNRNKKNEKYHEPIFTPNDLKSIDHTNGTFHYQNENGYTAVLSKKVYSKYDYSKDTEYDGAIEYF